MGKPVEVFAGTDSSGNTNLWVTDGTAAGTSEIKAVSNGVGGLNPSAFTVLGSEVLFRGDDSSGNPNLWVTDGTVAGTSELSPISGASFSGLAPSHLTAFGTKVLFDGTDASGHQNLWATNGTAAGTSELSVTGAPSGGLNPNFLTVLGSGTLLFSGQNTSGLGAGLWVTDGTGPGTSELTVAGAGTFFNPASYHVLGSKALFQGVDTGAHDNLFVTDGTSAGSSELSVTGSSSSGIFSSSTPPFFVINPDFTTLGTNVLFEGRDSSGNINLWVTDGTAGGTSELSATGAASSGLFSNVFPSFTTFGSKAVFVGIDSKGVAGLWVTDGSSAGTSELSVAGAASTGLNPSNFTIFGSKVLFAGADSAGNTNLWVTDGTAGGTSEIKAVSNGAGGLHPSEFAVFGNEVLFDGTDASGHPNLWMTDGTAAGTSELSIAGASSSGLSPSGFSPQFVAPCFVAGTRIAMLRGAVTVEDLRVGDRVLTANGKTKTIVWIGERRIDCTRHPHPELVWPVRIEADAFGQGLPARDLYLSPDHALFRDGVLIPVKYLANGASVAQQRVAAVNYFHVELDRHDILLAEGLPAESYLDTGNRAQFANGGAHVALHPDFAPLSWDDACAPLHVDGAALLEARRQLLARLPELGYRRTAASYLHLLACGQMIRATAIEGALHRFTLPAGCAEVRIMSRTGVPAGLDLAVSDCRTLGARIGAIFIDEQEVALDSPLLAGGFHPIERKGAELWRWTDGAARLTTPPSVAPIRLELLVRDTIPSWQVRRSTGEIAAA